MRSCCKTTTTADLSVNYVQRYAAEAWEALSAAPSPEELKEGPRVRHATKLKPFRWSQSNVQGFTLYMTTHYGVLAKCEDAARVVQSM